MPSNPMRTDEIIQVFGSDLGNEELEEIRSCIERQWIGMGPKTAEFEQAVAEHLGVDDFVLLNSGSSSLQMAIRLLDLPPGSEIILPSFTWVGCATAILLCGHRPVFCDVEEATQNIDVASVERVLGPRSAGVMAVHYAGLPAPIEGLLELGLPLVEDAAHAVDSKRGSAACGTLGDVGIFSFDSVKNLAMGEGGGVIARDPDRVRLARDLRNCGIPRSGYEAALKQQRWWEHEIADAFPKMLPSDVHAAIGLVQLRKLERLQRRRAEIWNRYQEELGELAWMRQPSDASPGDRHSYFTYNVRIKGGGRDELAQHLLDLGIYSTLRFHPLHLSPVYDCTAALPVTEGLMREALNLPLHPRLTDKQVGRVIDALRDFRR